MKYKHKLVLELRADMVLYAALDAVDHIPRNDDGFELALIKEYGAMLQAAPSPWQPISTCPLGVDVLMYHKEGFVDVGWKADGLLKGFDSIVTHWMPLEWLGVPND